MVDVVRQKLALQRDAVEASLQPALRLSPAEALLADLLLLLDDSICAACDSLQPHNMHVSFTPNSLQLYYL